jgi:hypothetical protein
MTKTIETAATATFRDVYAGAVLMRLEKHGKGWLWCCSEHGRYITAGYRPVANATRGIFNARIDTRFSEIEVTA